MTLDVALLDIESTLPAVNSQLLLPRHGILSVATAANQAGHNVDVFVDSLNGLPKNEVLKRYDVVGASVTAPNLNKVKTLFYYLRKQVPNTMLVVGGPHATIAPHEVLKFSDVAIRDEGEQTFVELLNNLDSGTTWQSIQGISTIKEGNVIHNSRRTFLDKPDTMEDLRLLHGFKRHGLFGQLFKKKGRYCGLAATSRGCPFPCSFCYENMIGGTGYRLHDIEVFIEDVRRKRDFFGTRHFWLADSNFGTNPKHCHQVLDAIIRSDLGVTFSCCCRVELGRRPELLAHMKKAGFSTICVGMEAIEDHTLASINKRQNVEGIIRLIDAAHEQGFAVFGLFMIGFDGDTEHSPDAIVSFCIKHDVDGLSIYCLTEYPSLPGRTLPRYRICEPNLDYHSGHFVATFPRLVRPSVMERSVYKALLRFYSHRRIFTTLLRRKLRSGLVFQIALYYQMRKLAKVSDRHQSELEVIEGPYYDNNNQLLEDYLKDHPIVTSPLGPDVYANWEDPAEKPIVYNS